MNSDRSFIKSLFVEEDLRRAEKWVSTAATQSEWLQAIAARDQLKLKLNALQGGK